jgi:hypothetical protein
MNAREGNNFFLLEEFNNNDNSMSDAILSECCSAVTCNTATKLNKPFARMFSLYCHTTSSIRIGENNNYERNKWNRKEEIKCSGRPLRGRRCSHIGIRRNAENLGGL